MASEVDAAPGADPLAQAAGDPVAPATGAGDGSLADIERRLVALERMAAMMDLLAVPGLLAGAAAKAFDGSFEAGDIPDQTAGVYPLETSEGRSFRWFGFPQGLEIRVPVFAGIPALLRVTTLEMAHLRTLEDFVFASTGAATVEPVRHERLGSGLFVAHARIVAGDTGLFGVSVSCRSKMETGGRDTRELGLPFVRAAFKPDLLGV